MKIVIPMAGLGQRFVDAGYTDPKPLIRLKGVDVQRRILARVVAMFEPSDEFVLICNERHLESTAFREAIYYECPNAQVVSMPCHKKGPVYTVLAAKEHIPDDEPTIVAYCDGAIRWDRFDFEEYVNGNEFDGCLLTHAGFHPHTLSRTTKMAFVRMDGSKFAAEVKEKASFTDDPMNEHASSGVYYFRTGEILKRYCERAIAETPGFNGEHYVTLIYNLMIQDRLRVGCFLTEHVAILGTPAEVANFEAWATILKGEQVRNEQDALRCYRYWRAYHEV